MLKVGGMLPTGSPFVSHDFKVMEACANNGFKRVLLELGGAPKLHEGVLGAPKCSVLDMGAPAVSGKSRLVKYYSI